MPPPNPDALTAWALSAHSRRVARHWFRHQRLHLDAADEIRRNLTIETWLIGPALDTGRLSQWFEDGPIGTTYRLMIHRTPLCYGNVPIPAGMLGAIPNYRYLGLRHRSRASPELRSDAQCFIEAILAAYQGGLSAVEGLMSQCGHPYWFSRG